MAGRVGALWKRIALLGAAIALIVGTAGCYAKGPPAVTGKRIIYSISQQRVVLVDESNAAIADFPVSGNLSLPQPGLYEVMNKKHPGRSGDLSLPFFTGFAWGPSSDIGFHAIPERNGVPIQNDWELGQPVSHGCVRVTRWWAEWIWHWAPIGTLVEVQG
ncbi:MAG: L,D-transpeptidase [Acidimicrobiia bacterium]